MTASSSPDATALPGFAFDNSYARLPGRFYARLDPEPVRGPRMLRVNRALAAELGLDADALATAEGAEALSGNRPPAGAEPLAMAYAGHQFGGWVPQLGDGRAHLLGEVVDREGRRRDIQLKGSGRTPFSRMGDGRAPLGPVLREFLVSEGMHALGVPTTRALAAVATGEPVVREAVSPGAVLTRVAASHIRVGTFQFFAARDDREGLRALADHAIARHDPAAAEAEDPCLALLEGVVARQARLIARWMGLGFIHGVMNTDNMTVSGETIDYGPCAFMEGYHPATVFSSIDRGGRYAYANQPAVGQWNLACLAQALLPVMAGGTEAALPAAQAAIDAFVGQYQEAWLAVFRAKLGLATAEDGDRALIEDLLSAMAASGADFTLTFRRLAELPEGPGPRDLFERPADFDAWAEVWQERLARDGGDGDSRRAAMLRTNPLHIPRNHLVEEAIAAAHRDDLGPFDALLAAVSRPFDAQPGAERLARPATAREAVRETFCGT